MPVEHRPDCELLTVETYGLCTCDFDKRMAAHEKKVRQWEREADRADDFYIEHD